MTAPGFKNCLRLDDLAGGLVGRVEAVHRLVRSLHPGQTALLEQAEELGTLHQLLYRKLTDGFDWWPLGRASAKHRVEIVRRSPAPPGLRSFSDFMRENLERLMSSLAACETPLRNRDWPQARDAFSECAERWRHRARMEEQGLLPLVRKALGLIPRDYSDLCLEHREMEGYAVRMVDLASRLPSSRPKKILDELRHLALSLALLSRSHQRKDSMTLFSFCDQLVYGWWRDEFFAELQAL